MEILRPTSELFDEALALLQAADSAVYGDSDRTEGELREEWDELDLERDAWLVASTGGSPVSRTCSASRGTVRR